MTFNPLMGRMVSRALRFVDPLTVCEFGNQRLMVDEATYQKIGMGVRPKTTKEFYEALGFTRYIALDVNEKMDAVVADLNEPIDLGEAFELVTNNGTGEHIFDQASVFRNAHDLCQVGGIMLHVQPFTPWLNHGFYNFNPILFRDLAAANRYQIAFMTLADRWGNGSEVDVSDEEWPFVEKNADKLKDAVTGKGNISIAVAFRKTSDAPFRKPVQGKYLADIASDALAERYR